MDELHIAPVMKLIRGGYITEKVRDGLTEAEAIAAWDRLRSRSGRARRQETPEHPWTATPDETPATLPLEDPPD